ncbi:MAG: DUF3052 domain-containing protein [Actinomycetes bacterium]
MSTTDAATEYAALIAKLEIASDMVIQELGYDDDCDGDLVDAIAQAAGTPIVGEDTDEVVDLSVLWWRDEDGDLVDGLVDSLTPLAEQGVVLLLTPKPGRSGHIEPSDIEDAARTAGLQPTSTMSASRNWQGTRLVSPRASRK